jgi:hypothetical protein
MVRFQFISSGRSGPRVLQFQSVALSLETFHQWDYLFPVTLIKVTSNGDKVYAETTTTAAKWIVIIG